MAGSPLDGKTSVAMGFDQGYPIRHEFYPVEQILSLMGKQVVTPKSVIATVTRACLTWQTYFSMPDLLGKPSYDHPFCRNLHSIFQHCQSN